jgi:hypothetical protein
MFTRESVETQMSLWRNPPGDWHRCLLSERSLNDEAVILRRYGSRLNPVGGWQSTRSRGRRHGLQQPYSAKEIEAFRSTFFTGGDARWRDHRTILSVGHGAGAARADAAGLRGSQVVDMGGHVAVVFVSADGSRVTVPVAGDYDDWLLARSAEVGPDGLMIASSVWINGGDLRPLPPRDLPPLTMQRLRNTWLCDRLRAGVPPQQVRQYGRFDGYGFLTSFAEQIPAIDDGDHLIRLLLGRS